MIEERIRDLADEIGRKCGGSIKSIVVDRATHMALAVELDDRLKYRVTDPDEERQRWRIMRWRIILQHQTGPIEIVRDDEAPPQ